MRILKIEWKNFSSYGNKKQILDFPEESSLFQIVGENGAGKTSISQVIAFGLYGKVEGKKLGDIPNRINGHTWVKVEFENNGKIVTVERGLEPSIFTLHINGILYDQAGNSNVQDYLTNDLIGIPYYVFNNTISLSINDFKSFIKMSPQDKRAIVDKIFGFHILNQMREVLKGESKKIKDDLILIQGKISTVDSSISESNKEMESLVDEIEKQSKEKITELNGLLDKFLDLQKIHSSRVDEFKEEETNLKSISEESTKLLIQTRAAFNDLDRRIKLYELEKCPSCESDLSGSFHENMKENLSQEKTKEENKLNECEDALMQIKESESDLKNRKKELTDKGNKIEVKIKEIQGEIKRTENLKSGNELKSLEKIISNLNDSREKLNQDSFKVIDKSNWLKTLDDILGEKGVKQMAIKTILPSLNGEISELLIALNLDYRVVFDEEFKASIYHMGIEIPTQTLSTGEMKKVDFVVLIAIMKLMKLKFSTINLLFLDELFSSVDPEGVTSILSILKKNSREMGLNIFVINHAQMPHEIFDWKLEVTKTNNFSSVSLDKF
jgi:DNA repair exonuclease SbcCD ATPase subunit